MKQLLLSKLPALFAALAAEQKLYIPADDAAGQANFTLWREGLQLTKKLNTVRSAKDLFFPQVENLVGFRVTGKQLDLVETRDPAEPFVLFGVRACDARSFAILDRVFLSEPQDTYYAARRAHGTVVTLACTRPEETCFCQAFGVDPAQPQGDVSCWMDAAALYWQANTEKGEALTAKLSMLEDTDGEAVKAQQAQTRAILKKLPLASLDLSAVGAGKTKALFDRPEWKQLSESCLGCGSVIRDDDCHIVTALYHSGAVQLLHFIRTVGFILCLAGIQMGLDHLLHSSGIAGAEYGDLLHSGAGGTHIDCIVLHTVRNGVVVGHYICTDCDHFIIEGGRLYHLLSQAVGSNLRSLRAGAAVLGSSRAGAFALIRITRTGGKAQYHHCGKYRSHQFLHCRYPPIFIAAVPSDQVSGTVCSLR